MTDRFSPAAVRAFLAAHLEAAPHVRRATLRDLRALVASGPLALSLAMASACGGSSEAGDSSAGEGSCTGESCAEQCQDRVDNDADGALDCDDSDCASQAACDADPAGTGGEAGAAATG
ncbi:MAG TPA: hypothetical protein PLU22_21890, partial [Polyangiaceae bacterium]|nr:hypothetical protein [Polyangiaceae bacterium]